MNMHYVQFDYQHNKDIGYVHPYIQENNLSTFVQSQSHKIVDMLAYLGTTFVRDGSLGIQSLNKKKTAMSSVN